MAAVAPHNRNLCAVRNLPAIRKDFPERTFYADGIFLHSTATISVGIDAVNCMTNQIYKRPAIGGYLPWLIPSQQQMKWKWIDVRKIVVIVKIDGYKACRLMRIGDKADVAKSSDDDKSIRPPANATIAMTKSNSCMHWMNTNGAMAECFPRAAKSWRSSEILAT